MTWIQRLRALPLRSKLTITVAGTVTAVLGASTFLSFRYWRHEYLAASEQQAILVGASARAALEATPPSDRLDPSRRSLSRLLAGTPVTAARVYEPGGRVLLSSQGWEEGRVLPGVWMPDPAELPRQGVARPSVDEESVRAFVPVSVPRPGVLEVELSVGPVQAAMERGARLGIGLMAVSVLSLGLVVATMFEREVVAPLHRMERALAGSTGVAARGGGDEVERLASSMGRLIEQERAVEELAAERDRRLMEQQGLATVGELAAEMTHELKRPLASIRSAIDMLQDEYALEPGGREVLDAVDAQLERLAATMQDLFSLANPVALERRPVVAGDLVDDALLEAAAVPGADRVVVRRSVPADLPPIEGDRKRLAQACRNLVANAVEAMPEGGTLRVEARAAPDGVELVFSDTGPGIPPAEIERAVRPFYSTKPHGTGLGLPLVARVVAAHGGRLTLDSHRPGGTTVRVHLPVSAGVPEPEEPPWRQNGSSSSTTTT